MHNFDDGMGWEPTPEEPPSDGLATHLADIMRDTRVAMRTWPARMKAARTYTRSAHHKAAGTMFTRKKNRARRPRHSKRQWFKMPEFVINYAGRLAATALTAGAMLIGTAFVTAPSTAAAGAPNNNPNVVTLMLPDDRIDAGDRADRSEPRVMVTKTPAPPKPVWVTPLASYRFTDCWGAGRNHKGLDLSAKTGTPIRAMHAGVIQAAGWKWRGYGISVLVKHTKDDKHYSHYAHMSKEIVSVGQRVVAGQVIGYVGSTGDSTGPHLHFEVWNGMWGQINPAPFMRSHGLKLKAGC